MKLLILNAGDVRQALPMPRAIDAMKEAFAALSSGQAQVPHRTHLDMPRHEGISLIMSACVADADPARESLAVKIVSLFAGNRARGLARIQALVVALDAQTGQPRALLDGATLTALRTAAASGAATDLLARPDSHKLALFGAGVQARAHVAAISAVRPIRTVAVYAPRRDQVDALLGELVAEHPGCQFVPAATPAQTLAGADIVVTATTSTTPVFADEDVPAGVHINAIGSFTPAVCEIPGPTVARARVFVDSRSAAWEEAGDLIQPRNGGLIGPDHIQAELGELVLGTHRGRGDSSVITLFKSVGIAVQDAVAARHAVEAARRLGLGIEL